MKSAIAPAPSPVLAAGPASPALRSATRSRRASALAYAAVLLELMLAAGFAVAGRPFDLDIYLWGGRAVTHGMRLYLMQADANWFTYPPFAASLFAPLAALPRIAVSAAWELASVAAFAWACALTLRLAGRRPCKTAVAAMAGAGFLLEPVYHTLYLGQVNLFLLALILADVWRAARGRTAGLGVGLAAAIKLTPAIFIVLFALTRRTRDAVIAAGTFAAACTLLGYLVDPSASRLYWTRLFDDTARVRATYISNQSPYAAAARILGGVSHVGEWYLAVPLILGALGLAVAATLARRQDWLGAAAVTGTTSLLVCPVSWTHHWVWIMPALAVLLRGGTASRVAAASGYLLFVLAPMWWTPRSGETSEYGFHGLVTLTANCFLAAGIAFLAYMAVSTWRPGKRPPAGRSPAPLGSPYRARPAPAERTGVLVKI